MKRKPTPSLSFLSLLLLAILTTSQTVCAFGIRNENPNTNEQTATQKQKLNEAVKRMKEKIVDLNEFGADGRSKPFTVNGPYGETLFVVKTVDGNFETTPSGFRVAPTTEDVTKWMFVQEDGSLGRSPGVKSSVEKEGRNYESETEDEDEDVITVQYTRRNKRHSKKVTKKAKRNKRNAKVEV